ncbi:unnamed protein product, partial [marine sediment metagenome]
AKKFAIGPAMALGTSAIIAAPSQALLAARALAKKATALVYTHPVTTLVGGGILTTSPKAREFVYKLPSKLY